MEQKKLLTIQDISCFGQCSLTVALPIISAMGIETVILPTAVLSTHTAGFKNYTVRDLSQDITDITNHWNSENIKFDTFYTGYLCGKGQIEQVINLISMLKKPNSLVVIDPVMADNGVFYKGFDQDFANEMAKLCSMADVILPNITEACFLTGENYIESGYDKQYIENLLKKLGNLGAKNVVLTGVSFEQDKLGIAVYNSKTEEIFYYFNDIIPHNFHGTGDVYSSTVAGGLTKGYCVQQSASLAVDFTVEAMKKTFDKRFEHWYGVMFEQALPYLCKRVEQFDNKQ